jgi:hypothetical protein
MVEVSCELRHGDEELVVMVLIWDGDEVVNP